MKTKQITLKGFANVLNDKFIFQFRQLEKQLIESGYNKLPFNHNLHGKKATEKIIIKAWYFRGNWNDKSLEQYNIFYK